MRGELVIPVVRLDAYGTITAGHDAWLVVACCLISFAATAYFLTIHGWAENLGELVAQANLW